jgi:hypothetical protein
MGFAVMGKLTGQGLAPLTRSLPAREATGVSGGSG